MKIVADENIPQVAEAFADLGEVQLLPGRDIASEHLTDCQCLIVRTVTRVDQALLQDSAIRFVASATIGTDHIDRELLQQRHIGFANAPGCNAEAASAYVISGLFALSANRDFDPFKRKAGIIGYGNVGSRLRQKLAALGIPCLVNDPPLQSAGRGDQAFVDLDTLLRECDFISLHVPLVVDGDHPTYHLLDKLKIENLAVNCLLVNAARGEVVDNQALLEVLGQRDDLAVFLDTWEGEPFISRELMRRVDLATPHIAGYSVEGRLRGTQMILDAACRFFARSSSWRMSRLIPEVRSLQAPAGDSKVGFWQALFQAHCDIWRDHEALLSGSKLVNEEFARHFDSLRRVYQDRLEYERFQLKGVTDENTAAIARQLRFRLDY